MKKYILIAILLLTVVFGNAQNIIKPSQVLAKDVYVLTKPSTEFTKVKWIDLTENQINGTNSIEDRLELFIKKSKDLDFDAVMTRDGKSVLLMKYNKSNQEPSCNLIDFLGKDVYFLSIPSKKYTEIKIKSITKDVVHLPFNKIVEKYMNSEKGLEFDAIIVDNNEVKFIAYK